MRIEHQGYVEVQPQYQHVGYLSAAVQGAYVDTRFQGVSFGLLGLGIMAIAAAFIVARRTRPVLARGAAACVLLIAGVCAAYLGVSNAGRVRTLAPDYYVTLRNIEEACALTESWAAELGRCPTQAEWDERMAGRACALDGWGRSLTYTSHPTVAPGRDGQLYTVSSPGKHPSQDDFAGWRVYSSDLGPDGVFGSADDSLDVGRRGGDWTDPTRYAHGRTPREVAP